jgi:hypothetical protein
MTNAIAQRSPLEVYSRSANQGTTNFYGTGTFISALTRGRYLSLTWVREIQSTTFFVTHLRSILMLSYRIYTWFFRVVPFLLAFQPKYCIHFSAAHKRFMPLHSILVNLIIVLIFFIVKTLVIQVSKASRHFIPLKSKIFSQLSPTVFYTQCHRTSLQPHKIGKYIIVYT